MKEILISLPDIILYYHNLRYYTNPKAYSIFPLQTGTAHLIVLRRNMEGQLLHPIYGYTVNWNLFAREFFDDVLRMFEITKNFNGDIAIIVMMNFRNNLSIAKIFPSKFPGILANIFQRKIIPVYSTVSM